MLAKVEERKSGALQHTTTFSYDENGNPKVRGHDSATARYEYDVRDLTAKITEATLASDPNPKVSTFTYTPTADRLHEVKGNRNTVDYDYDANNNVISETVGGATTTSVYDRNRLFDGQQIRPERVHRRADLDGVRLKPHRSQTFTLSADPDAHRQGARRRRPLPRPASGDQRGASRALRCLRARRGQSNRSPIESAVAARRTQVSSWARSTHSLMRARASSGTSTPRAARIMSTSSARPSALPRPK